MLVWFRIAGSLLTSASPLIISIICCHPSAATPLLLLASALIPVPSVASIGVAVSARRASCSIDRSIARFSVLSELVQMLGLMQGEGSFRGEQIENSMTGQEHGRGPGQDHGRAGQQGGSKERVKEEEGRARGEQG
jgi:hypothetical protein